MPFENSNPTLRHEDLGHYLARGRQLRSIAMRDAFRAMVRRVKESRWRLASDRDARPF